MTIKKLRSIVQEYKDELSYKHPFVTSDRFVDNSYAKWACGEILKSIDRAEDLPFKLTPFEILEQFCDKMKRYAYMNAKNSIGFSIAAETAEYLMEQYWLFEGHSK